MSFSWVPFYRELAGKVLEFEDRQDELLQLVLQMHDEKLFGVTAKTLDVIEPFTFFSVLNVLGNERRIKACGFLATEWNLQSEIPTEFNGVPEITPQNCWFFSYIEDRAEDDIAFLWQAARAVRDSPPENLADDILKRALQISTVGLSKITIGFYWFNPTAYLPLDKQMKAVLNRKKIVVDLKAMASGDWKAYLKFIGLAKQKLGGNFPQISYNAWLARNDGDDEDEGGDETMNQPLNQILYGPPGTGKTYTSIQKAVEIIEDRKLPDDEAKARFIELRDAGQIQFVTFHQSFSYEEFIEGLRPVIGSADGQVRYEIRDGILKKMALEAIYAGLHHRNGFEQAWELFMNRLADKYSYEIPGLTDKSRFLLQIDGETIFGENVLSLKTKSNFSCEKEQLQKLWDAYLQDWVINSSKVKKVLPDMVGEGAFVAAVYNAMGVFLLADYENSAKKWLAGSDNYEPNDEDELNRYVLIIDEINRGNISKILGELITLLEDDKRIGAPNELRLTLPTSGETFALPPNLYLLGTMNTSDKSLAQLDVALRRRFSFQEMPPRLELCDRFPAQIPVLRELNNRLEWALDREHRLGHAYFMNVESEADFNEVFRSKVVPLLIEYFPHDFQTLRAVLGEKSDGFLCEMSKPDGFSGGGKKYRW